MWRAGGVIQVDCGKKSTRQAPRRQKDFPTGVANFGCLGVGLCGTYGKFVPSDCSFSR